MCPFSDLDQVIANGDFLKKKKERKLCDSVFDLDNIAIYAFCDIM